MRIRSIKPEFWSSQSNGRLSRNARLIFIGLWSVADNFGRFRAEPRVLAGSILPYDRDALAVVRRALAELVSEGKIELYEHERSEFGSIRAFAEHQWMKTRGKPIHPDPRDPGSIPIGRQVEDSSDDGESRLGEGSGVKDQGSGVKDQGAGRGRDRSPKKRPVQPELPGTPPAPPKPPRAKSAQEQAHAVYVSCRRDVMVSELGIEHVPDDAHEPIFVNVALGPILERTDPDGPNFGDTDDLPVTGFEKLVRFWLTQPWAAAMKPPFPFKAFAGLALTKDPAKPGLIDRWRAGE